MYSGYDWCMYKNAVCANCKGLIIYIDEGDYVPEGGAWVHNGDLRPQCRLRPWMKATPVEEEAPE